MVNTFEVEVQTDTETNELFFEIPPELLKNLGWKTGDDLKWEETDNGVFLRKVKYETVELELEDEDYIRYLKYAHENNMSFSELAEKAVKEAINKNEN